MRGGGPFTPAGGALGRQPAEARRRAGDLPRPEGADRGAADARARRRRDRVPPPAARDRARRGPRDPARVARARGDPLALRPHPRALRGRDRREHEGAVSEEQIGFEMVGVKERGRRMTEPPTALPPEPPEQAARPGPSRPGSRSASAPAASPCRSRRSSSPSSSAASSCSPTGHNPLLAYHDIFNGAGLNWIFHPTTSTSVDRRVQPHPDAAPVDDAHPHRARRRVRLPLRDVQHRRPGPVLRRPDRRELARRQLRRHEHRSRTSCSRSSARRSPARRGRASPASSRRPTGAHEVISTIMLNYIALYRRPGSSATAGRCRTRPSRDGAGLERIAHTAQLPVIWGTQGFQGLDIGFLIAIAALVVFWALINRTTLGYEVRAVGFNPDAAAYGGINVKKNLIRAMAISGAFAGLAGAVDMLGYLYHYGSLDVPVSSGRLHRHRRGAARSQHRRRRRSSARCSSAASSTGRRRASART